MYGSEMRAFATFLESVANTTSLATKGTLLFAANGTANFTLAIEVK